MATFDEMDRRLAQYPQRLEGEVRRAMSAGLLILEIDQRRHVAQDTRQLHGSINPSPIEGSGVAITGSVGPSKNYGVVVERGRRPKRRMPPPAALRGWALRHGFPVTRGALFVLARSIGRKGTQAQPFVSPSLRRNRRRIVALFGRAGARVTAFLAGRA